MKTKSFKSKMPVSPDMGIFLCVIYETKIDKNRRNQDCDPQTLMQRVSYILLCQRCYNKNERSLYF